MPSKIQRLWRSSQPVLGAQLRFGWPAIAELFSLAGFDWLFVDSEHASQTPVGIQLQLQAMAAGDPSSACLRTIRRNTATTCDGVPIVRVLKNDPDLIRLYLDMGGQGVLVAAACQRIAAAMKQVRGNGPT